MAVDIKDVPAWCYLWRFKTAHALVWAEGDGRWCQTLCGTLTSGHTRHEGNDLPTTICRKCRKLLKEKTIQLER